ncbi:MAG: MaoC/PaaZ C-terminal domain-containing protein [Zavarzinella sp.]
MFSSFHLYFEDVEIGQEWLSVGRTVTQADIVNFAGISGDFNPIHMDHVYAKSTPFRQPIAHGLLVFTMASGLGLNCPPMRTLAFLRVGEWLMSEPVYIGDTLRLKAQVVDKTVRGRGRRGEIKWKRIVLNQDDRIVQQGEIVTIVEGRGAKVLMSLPCKNGSPEPVTVPEVAPKAS